MKLYIELNKELSDFVMSTKPDNKSPAAYVHNIVKEFKKNSDKDYQAGIDEKAD